MSVIEVILETDSDGTLHLPVPEELRGAKIKVEARLERVDVTETGEGTFLEAVLRMRAKGGLKHIIPDPLAWQKEQREDRPLPGREG